MASRATHGRRLTPSPNKTPTASLSALDTPYLSVSPPPHAVPQASSSRLTPSLSTRHLASPSSPPRRRSSKRTNSAEDPMQSNVTTSTLATQSFYRSRFDDISTDRSSSETTAVTIYSMYGGAAGEEGDASEREERSSWVSGMDDKAEGKIKLDGVEVLVGVSTSREFAGSRTSHRDYLDVRQSHASSTQGDQRMSSVYGGITSSSSGHSDGTSQNGSRPSSGVNAPSTKHALTGFPHPPSRQSSDRTKRPLPSNPRPSTSISNSVSADSHRIPSASPNLSRTPTHSPQIPNSQGLIPPTALSIPLPASRAPSRPETASSAPSDHSHSLHPSPSLSRAPSEEADAFHVRSTYARLEAQGVPGDGYDEGIERTRARVSATSTRLLEGAVKGGEISEREEQLLKSLDRYGFFLSALSTRQESRIALLPAKPLAKVPRRFSLGSSSPPPDPKAPAMPPELTSVPAPQPPPKEAARIAKWVKMMRPEKRDEGGNVEVWGFDPRKDAKMRPRVWKGVPDTWRAGVWWALVERFERSPRGRIGAEELGRQYRDYCERPSTYDVQIDLDVPRTISGHVLFHTRYGQGQRSLFHVLHAFSLICSECGYCQGMGPIAATLLCYLEPERTYASLVRLHDEYGMHTIFMPGFPGLLEGIYVQERLIERLMPEVYQSFKKHMISTTSYATKWYITLFANTVPFQTQLRIWDAFLLEGRDVMVAVAVAIIWVLRQHLASPEANFETILSLLSSFFVPEDEDTLFIWIQKMLENKRLREEMKQWRVEWGQLVATGQDGKALL